MISSPHSKRVAGPLGVAVQAAWVVNVELPSQVGHHLSRHVQRVRQERAEPADGRQLEGEPEAVVVPAAGDQFLVQVVEEEGQLR